MPPLFNWRNLTGVPETLTKFASAPVSFILGALLSVALGGFETIIEAFLTAILALFDSVVFVATSTVTVVLDAGGGVGDILLGALTAFFDTIEGAMSAAGPGAPLLAAGLVALTVVVGAYTIRFVWTLVVDSINPL